MPETTALAVPTELQHNERSKKLCRILESAGLPQIQKSLPRALGLNPTRFLQQIFTSIQSNPTLSACEPVSLVISCVKAAQAGIPIDGVHGALVPFKDHGVLKAQFIPMYQGLMQAALRSGLVKSFRPPRAVYEGDEFDYEFGLNETLRHKPAEDPENQNYGSLLYVYAIAQLKDSDEKAFVVIPKISIEATRMRSKAQGDQSPWNVHPVAMALKTAVRNLCKFLPKSADDMAFVAMLAEDEAFDAGIASNVRDDALARLIEAETVKNETPPPKPSMDELAAQVVKKRAARAAKEEPEPEPENELLDERPNYIGDDGSDARLSKEDRARPAEQARAAERAEHYAKIEHDKPRRFYNPKNNDTFSDADDAATAQQTVGPVDPDTGEVLIETPVPTKPKPKPKEKPLPPLPPPTKAPPLAQRVEEARGAPTATPATVSTASINADIFATVPIYDFSNLPPWSAWRENKVGGNYAISAKTWDSLLGGKPKDWVHKIVCEIVKGANDRLAKNPGAEASEISQRAAYILTQLNTLFAV
jgi:recombination protein RecT